MPDKSLQARTMRKTVERVDIGVFGLPMRAINWVKKTKSSWGGWFAMTAAQVAVGVSIALLAGLVLGVPLNPFSIAILVGFALGSAIGGPFSFALWSVILITLTGLGSGLITGAWVSSPSWWRTLAAGWQNNEAVPGWFMVAVPVWMLFWIAASRGIAKLAELILESMALKMGFRAAQRFSGEDKRVYDEAFEQSDVSQAETASLLESSGDGTHAVITGEPSKIAGVQHAMVREMGGDPDVSTVPLPDASGEIDYDSFLDAGSDDPEVLKAVGRKPSGLEKLSDEDVDPAASETETPTGVVIEMEPLDLPAVPRDTAPPLQRVEAPKLDPRQNRALLRRMTQLNLAFQTARREDRDAEFIDKHQDELAVISDEQRQILESMNDTGPLLALVHSIQRKRTEDFLVGKAEDPTAVTTGAAVTADTSSEEEDDVPFAIDIPQSSADGAAATDDVVAEVQDVPTVADESAVEALGEAEPAPARPRRDIAALAASFSDVLSPRRTRDNADETVETVETADAVDAAETVDDAVIEDAAPQDEVPSQNVVETSATADAVIEASDEIVDAGEQVVTTEDAPAEVDAIEDSSTESVEAVEEAPVVHEIPSPPAARNREPEVEPEAKLFEFEFDVELEEAAPEDAGADETAAAKADDEANEGVIEDVAAGEPEEVMSSRVFSRSVCRQVLGLVVGPLAPDAKADDVAQFEKDNPGVLVAEVLNSRSFDDQVGAQDAAAARHAWKDVKQVLSQSSLDRLMSDLERVNLRGEALVEEPHTLTVSAFHLFESESSRLRRLATAPGDNDAVSMTADLVGRNVAILDTLTGILKARTDAASRAQTTPGGIVRQKVAPGRDDVAASRGRSMIGSVLGGARIGGVGIMRDTPAKDVVIDQKPVVTEETTPVAEDKVTEASKNEEIAMNDAAAESAVVEPAAATQLRPGDDGFVSPHPVGTIGYEADMKVHAFAIETRQQLESAERERKEQEESDRQREADAADEARAAEAAAEIERKRLADEAEATRRREAEEADAARKAEADAAEEARREALAKIERDSADAERRRREDEAAAAALVLEREQAAAARSKEDEAILKQFRDRQRDLEIPERFRTDEIIAHGLALADLRNIRMMFQRSVIGAKADGMSPLEAAMRVPSARSLLQTEAEMGREAAGILTRIASMVDATDPEDSDAIRALLDPTEVPFFERIMGNATRGRASLDLLEKADDADRELREKANRAADVEALEQRLSAANSELDRVRAEATASSDTAREAIERAERAEEEKRDAAARLDALRKEMSGIVDDDFQKVLEGDAKRIEVGGVDGFFSFMSPDTTSMVVVMTTPASTFPNGLIQRGSKSLTVADFLEFAVSRAREFGTDHVAVFYTDPQMRAYAANAEGITMKLVQRSVDELKTSLEAYGINIDNKGV